MLLRSRVNSEDSGGKQINKGDNNNTISNGNNIKNNHSNSNDNKRSIKRSQTHGILKITNKKLNNNHNESSLSSPSSSPSRYNLLINPTKNSNSKSYYHDSD